MPGHLLSDFAFSDLMRLYVVIMGRQSLTFFLAPYICHEEFCALPDHVTKEPAVFIIGLTAFWCSHQYLLYSDVGRLFTL